MILDLQTQFSGVTSAAGVKTGDAVTVTAISNNVIDLRQAAASITLAVPALVDEGINPTKSWVIIQTDGSAAWAAAGAATLTITLESDSTANLATAPVVHFSSAAIPKATLLANTVVARFGLPSDNYKRFLGLRYTVATGPFTAGAILAFMSTEVQRNITYQANFQVS